MSLTIPDLATARLKLTALSFDHSDGMFRLWSHPEVCRHSGPANDHDGHPIRLPATTPADSDKIIDFWNHAARGGWGFRWAVLDAESSEFLGIFGFNALGAVSEIAYHLHPDHWGHGFMAEAAAKAINWVAHEMACQIIEAYIDPPNSRSIALAERLSLSKTGEMRDGADQYRLSTPKRPS